MTTPSKLELYKALAYFVSATNGGKHKAAMLAAAKENAQRLLTRGGYANDREKEKT